MRSSWRRLRLLLLLAMLFVPSARFDATPAVDAHASTSPTGPAAGGLRVHTDRETGDRIATREAVEASLTHPLREALRQSADGLTIVERADGSKHVDLRGRYSCGTVVHVGPNGVVQRCVSSPVEAEAARRTPVANRRASELE